MQLTLKKKQFRIQSVNPDPEPDEPAKPEKKSAKINIFLKARIAFLYRLDEPILSQNRDERFNIMDIDVNLSNIDVNYYETLTWDDVLSQQPSQVLCFTIPENQYTVNGYPLSGDLVLAKNSTNLSTDPFVLSLGLLVMCEAPRFQLKKIRLSVTDTVASTASSIKLTDQIPIDSESKFANIILYAGFTE